MHKILMCWICLLILVTGCQPSLPPSSIEQRLNLNIPSDPSTLDPRKGGDLTSSVFHFLLFTGLTRLDDEGNVALALAEKVNISQDRTVYTFFLHDALWSDGTPITAWDFEKSWKDILHPDFPAMNAHLLYPIKNAEGAKKGTHSLSEVGIRSIDAKTLEITLEEPTPHFLNLIAFCIFSPVNAEIDHSAPDWEQQIGEGFICSGPFFLKEWRRNNEIVLAKNPNYFKASEVKLEEIQFYVINNEMTALQMFEKGQIDILGLPMNPLPTDAIPILMKEGLLKLHPVPGTTFCSFNVNVYPFHNKNIRKALGYAINRRQIVHNITQKEEKPALGMIPPMLKRFSWKNDFFYDADVVTARKFFAKGLKELKISPEDFPKIKYLYCISEADHKIAQALQQQWNETLGIQVELESVDKKILLHLLKTGNYHSAQSFWIAQYLDPMNIFERFKYKDNVKNYPNWENATFIDVIQRSCKACTEQERAALLEKAESIFLEEMPLVPIFHWNSGYITQPYVKSFGTATIGNGYFDRVFIDYEEKKKTF
jgi:oligopeptide transport system substrate-binding protein